MFCLNYNKDTEHCECLKECSYWTIEYNKKDSTLLEFLNINKDKKLVLYIKDIDIDIKLLEELSLKYPNLEFKLGQSWYKILKENKINISNYFFDTQINNWDTLIGIINMGVSSVYISEELCFSLDKIKNIVSGHNITIRTYINVAQSSWNETDAFKKFFIRPEDLDVYSEYIDIFEFYNIDKVLDTYYRIYAIDKKWFGKLNEIILDFNSEIDNRYVIPKFAETRIKCDKNCLKGGKCRRCEVIEDLSYALEKSELIVKN